MDQAVLHVDDAKGGLGGEGEGGWLSNEAQAQFPTTCSTAHKDWTHKSAVLSGTVDPAKRWAWPVIKSTMCHDTNSRHGECRAAGGTALSEG